MELDRTEARILGALIEKRWTTPDQYPLTINALVAACNQKSNRDPVLELLEFEISGCLLSLRQRGLIVQVERAGSRVIRNDGRLEQELDLSRQEGAIMAELLLRGPQAAGELSRRCKRMAQFNGPNEAEAVLRDLAERRFVKLMPRESGQRLARWTELLTTQAAAAPAAPADDASDDGTDEPNERIVVPALHDDGTGPVMGQVVKSEPPPSLREELDALREEVARLKKRVEELENLATA